MIEKRLLNRLRVNSDNGCWEFQGGLNPDGYGILGVEGRFVRAHRLAWSIWCEPIPDNICVLHRCDNRRCCNPEHLFLGTKADNNLDCRLKGRMSCGASRPEAKLNENSVREIRKKFILGHSVFGINGLARSFKVSENTIRKAVKGQKWRHVS